MDEYPLSFLYMDIVNYCEMLLLWDGWVSGAVGPWEEALNQAYVVDQLCLSALCHSKLAFQIYPEPGEALTC